MRPIAMLTVVVAAAWAISAGAEDKKFDAKSLEGTWKVTGGKKAGSDLSDMSKEGDYVFTKDSVTIKAGDMELFVMKFKIDEKASPMAIDMEITKSPGDSANGGKAEGIIEVKGDEMKICYPPMGGDRPKKFDGSDKYYYFVLKKQKKDK